MSATLWRPPCPCGKACLPPAQRTVGLFTTVARLLAAASVLLAAMVRPAKAALTARRLLRAMGIRWSLVGAPIGKGVLLAGNHVSWLDIVLMMALASEPDDVAGRPAAEALSEPGKRQAARRSGGPGIRLVGKHDVAAWPVIGRLAKASGTIFVDRSRPKTLPGTVSEVTAALRGGQTVQVFPEGTTTCGAHPAAWRPAFLQAAIDAGAPVQRFTLLFSTPAAAFVDDETLLHSLWRVVRARGLSITVLMDEPLPLSGSRRSSARRLSPARVHRPNATASP